MLAARHRQAHAEEQHAELAGFHTLGEVFKLFEWNAGLVGNRGIELHAFDQRPQGPEGLKVLPRLDQQEDVRGGSALALTNIDEDHGPVLAAIRHEKALGHRGIPAPVPRVRFRRVRAPEDHQVRAVLHFAERAGDFADALKRHTAGTVANRSRRIDAAADPVRDRDGHTLRFASRVGQSVDNRIAGTRQNLRGPLDGFFQRRRLAFDRGDRPLLDMVVEEPRLAKHAGVLRLGDLVVLDG